MSRVSERELRSFLRQFEGMDIIGYRDNLVERFGQGRDEVEVEALLVTAWQRHYLKEADVSATGHVAYPHQYPRWLTVDGYEFINKRWWKGREIALAGVVLGFLGILERLW